MGLIFLKYSVTVIVIPLTNLVAIDPYNLALFPKFLKKSKKNIPTIIEYIAI